MVMTSDTLLSFGVGLAIGLTVRELFSRKKTAKVKLQPPARVFKLCVESELKAFQASGKVESSLDRADGFIHLSDRTSPKTVASLFFAGAQDLFILEIDATRLNSDIQWLVGVMGEDPPSAKDLSEASTPVHYLIANGCVHVYGSSGVSMSIVTQVSKVPLGSDGKHVFPVWL